MKWHVLNALEWIVDVAIKLLIEVVGEIVGTMISGAMVTRQATPAAT